MDSSQVTTTTSSSSSTYPPWVAFIYLFNLIVGTGALAMPKAFSHAGWLVSLIIVVALAVMSFITVTFVIETMSIANFIEKRNRIHRRPAVAVNNSMHMNGGSEVPPAPSDENGIQTTMVTTTPSGQDQDDADDEEDASETNPLLDDTNDPSSKLYDITIQKQLVEMGKLFLPRYWLQFTSISLSIYLYGDLVIYTATIAKSMRDVTCTWTNDTLEATSPCWIVTSDFVITRSASYRMFVASIFVTLVPLAYFNVQKTTLLQVVTSICRWVAFISMITLATIILIRGDGKGSPVVGNIRGVPNLFGVAVYSFMCHHSLPLLITPIRQKEKSLYSVLLGDYVLILTFYLIMSFTAIYAFDNLQDIYTLNFQEKFSSSYAIIDSVKFLTYFLPLFPVFTLSTSFPIIAISLRKNLSFILKPWIVRKLSRNTNQRQEDTLLVSSHEEEPINSPKVEFYTERFILPSLAVFPPVLLAFATENLQLLVGFVGSYAGMAVQYVTPALLILYARRKHQGQVIEELAPSTTKIRERLRSPFRDSIWIYIIFAWAVITWIFVTIDHIVDNFSTPPSS